MHLFNTFGRWILALGVLVATAQAASGQTSLLVAAIANEKTAVFIDPASGKVVGRVPIDDDAHDVTASTDGKLVFTANGTPGTISVVDVATRKELRRVVIGPTSHVSRLTYKNGKLFFSAGEFKIVGRYDPVADRIDWLAGTGYPANLIADTANGDKAFVTNREANSVSAIEGMVAGPPKWTVTNIPLNGSPEGIDVSPDGREVWVAKRFGGGIAIIDTATKKITQLDVPFGTPGPGSAATRVSFTPDGTRVLLLHRPTKEVVVFDAATRKEIKRLSVPGASILVQPDSSKAYVSVEQSPETGGAYAAVIDLKTLQVTGKVVIPEGKPVPCAGHCDTMALTWAGK